MHISATLNKLAIGVVSIAMNIKLKNVSVYCTASKKKTLLYTMADMMSDEYFAITLVNFFHEKNLFAEQW